MRVTRLATDFTTPAGASGMIVTNSLIKADFKVVEEAGDDFTVKNACGGLAYSYTDGARLRRFDCTLTMTNPDIELTEMLTAGSLITAGGLSIGYSAPAIGTNPIPGVCLELWSKAWIGGGPPPGVSFTDGATTTSSATLTSAGASFSTSDIGRGITGTGIPGGATISSVTNSTTVVLSAVATATGTGVTITIARPGNYFRWVFPRFVGSLGDFSLDDGVRATMFNGPCFENPAIGNGPNNDFPAGMVGSRMFSYFRDSTLPTTSIGYSATPTQI